METINDLSDYKFGDGVILKVPTSLAWNGADRSAGNAVKMTVQVDLSGVLLEDLANKAGETLRVDFQRTRRDKNSGGSLETKEHYDELIEEYRKQDFRPRLHFNVVGHSPKVLTPEEVEATADQALSQMTPEQLMKYAEKAAERARAKQAQAEAEEEAELQAEIEAEEAEETEEEA